MAGIRTGVSLDDAIASLAINLQLATWLVNSSNYAAAMSSPRPHASSECTRVVMVATIYSPEFNRRRDHKKNLHALFHWQI